MQTIGFAPFAKVAPQDDGTIRVSGWASTESVDKDGEIILASAVRNALPDYLKFPAVREMHGPKAIGKALNIDVRPDGRTWIEAHVVDPDAVAKVRAGVLRGFSIGGRILKRDPNRRNVITALRLSEVSLVDRPANSDCAVVLAKFDQPERAEPERVGLPYEHPDTIAKAMSSHVLAGVAHDAVVSMGYRPGGREYAEAFGAAMQNAAGLITKPDEPQRAGAPSGPSAAALAVRQRRAGGLTTASPVLFGDLYKGDMRANIPGDDERFSVSAHLAAGKVARPGTPEYLRIAHEHMMESDDEYRAAHAKAPTTITKGASFDPEEHPRDRDGRFTEAAHRAGLKAGPKGSPAYQRAAHRHAMETDEAYRAEHSQVVEENRGTRRGRPWGTAAGALAGGVAGAALGAKAPSKIAGVTGTAAAGAAAGVVRGALRGLRKPGPWPSKVANAAFAAATEATRGVLAGGKAGARHPRAANAAVAGTLGAVAGGTVGGAVGEVVGVAHDRIRTTRTVEKADRGGAMNDTDLQVEAERLSKLSPEARALEMIKMAQRVALEKYSTSQPRDDQGRFAASPGTGESVGHLVGALAGGVVGGMAAGALALPTGPGVAVAGVAGEMAGSALGEAAGAYVGRQIDRALGPQDHEARQRAEEHRRIVAVFKNPPAAKVGAAHRS